MPLVVLAGQPASGKSTVAAQLVELLQQAGTVELVDEPSLHLERNAAYASSRDEKITRASLKSSVERVLSKQQVVILDSLNNIKGYRYEVWCVARMVGTRYCVVHVDASEETCRRWNEARPEAERYTPQIFDDLARRFEMPDARNRWEAPLFTLRPAVGSQEDNQEVLEAVVAFVNGASSAAGVAAGVVSAGGQALQPTVATNNPGLQGTNVLHDIDHAAQVVVNAISEAQAQAGGGAAGVVDLGAAGGKLRLERPMTLAELRRHKRAFLKLATKMAFSRISDAATAQRLFTDYLRQQQL